MLCLVPRREPVWGAGLTDPRSFGDPLGTSRWRYEHHDTYFHHHQTFLLLFIWSHLFFGLKQSTEKDHISLLMHLL